MVEDLVEELILDQIELFERRLNGRSIIARGEVKRLSEAKRGVMHQHLGVLQAFGVLLQVHLDEIGIMIDLFERSVGLIVVAIDDLFDGQFSHGVDEFRVEVALIARVGLLGAEFELAEGLGVWDSFVDSSVKQRSEGEEQKGTEEEAEGLVRRFHNAPRRERLPRVIEGDKAVAGLPLLIREFAVRHGEKLLVQVRCLFDLMEFVVRGRRQEEG